MRCFFVSLAAAAAIALGSATPAVAADLPHAEMVRQTMAAFSDGLAQGDMSAFHAPEPSSADSESGVGFLVERRTARASTHDLLRDVERNLPKGAELVQVEVLEGVVQVIARAAAASVLVEALGRASTLQAPSPVDKSTTDARMDALERVTASQNPSPEDKNNSFKIRATARPASATSAASPAPAFLAGADFEAAAGELTVLVKDLLARKAGAQRCEAISTTFWRSILKGPHERVTVKVRLRCTHTDPLLRVLGELEDSPPLFVDDLKVRIRFFDVGGKRVAQVNAGFDLYGYLQGAKGR